MKALKVWKFQLHPSFYR